ncbi:exported hypothetical protein [Verrucomicrobia bacterium]|nr:exported hypothetical protein [Verrucomicrobiota bacterium]
MKTKFLLLGIGALLVVGGLWATRAAWRAQHQLVTLNVRNTPLAEVLRTIQRQTWTKIRAEQGLEARITLNVRNKPLALVLDRLAEQAGAHWSTLYVVYDSPRALQSLDSTLRADGKLGPAGWEKIAPNPPAFDPPGLDGARVLQPSGPNPNPSAPFQGQRRMIALQRDKNGPVFFAEGANGEMEVWSPQELLLQASMDPQGDTEHTEPATAESAAQLARKLHGRWATYMALRKSSLGVGMGDMPGPRPGLEAAKPDPNETFARLTPEQRVLRARQRLQFKSQSPAQ